MEIQVEKSSATPPTEVAMEKLEASSQHEDIESDKRSLTFEETLINLPDILEVSKCLTCGMTVGTTWNKTIHKLPNKDKVFTKPRFHTQVGTVPSNVRGRLLPACPCFKHGDGRDKWEHISKFEQRESTMQYFNNALQEDANFDGENMRKRSRN